MAKRKWWIRIVIGIVVVLSGWVLYVSSKQIERNRRIEDEVTSLQSEAVKIKRENETLSEKIQYFSSDDFREQEAKKKLGLKKTDETVVVINPRPEDKHGDTVSGASSQVPENNGNEVIPNYKKWWNIFFERS